MKQRMLGGTLPVSAVAMGCMRLADAKAPADTVLGTALELGIDIGKLERIIQIGGPNSVSSFLQRLGRSGRRGDPPEMMMVFREETPLPNAPLPELIPWELLRAIAVVQLYVEERFIEPPFTVTLPFSLLFHQTMSCLASRGGMTPAQLAASVLSLPPFSSVNAEDYKTLIVSMINDDYLELTDDGDLIIGLRGERIINSYKFFAVFKDSDDFTVRCGSDEIELFPPRLRREIASRLPEESGRSRRPMRKED